MKLSLAGAQQHQGTATGSMLDTATPLRTTIPPAPSLKARLLDRLKPLDSGPREIRALDGLRAVAALSVLGYHLLYLAGFRQTPAGAATYPYWHWLVTGVQLFFVLSGFLLFLPHARAMLRGTPLPPAKRFYQRRALRILPAYWVCLLILAVVPTSAHTVPFSLGDAVTHILMIHDSFPNYSRDLEGPFWTLAVEAQFYMVLPLLAAGIARVVGRSRSRTRLVGCLLALLLVAVLVRHVDGILMGMTPSYSPRAGSAVSLAFVLLTYGLQGKFLDIFAIGMLASVVYVVTVEHQRLSSRTLHLLGWLCAAGAIVLAAFVTMPNSGLAEAWFLQGHARGWPYTLYPLAIGSNYALLLLAALWGSRALRFPFELAPLRFVGLISYSLYLWHVPILEKMLPGMAGLPFKVTLPLVIPVAYLSYQLVERPFLKRRRATTERRSSASGSPGSKAITAPLDSQPTAVFPRG